MSCHNQKGDREALPMTVHPEYKHEPEHEYGHEYEYEYEYEHDYELPTTSYQLLLPQGPASIQAAVLPPGAIVMVRTAPASRVRTTVSTRSG